MQADKRSHATRASEDFEFEDLFQSQSISESPSQSSSSLTESNDFLNGAESVIQPEMEEVDIGGEEEYDEEVEEPVTVLLSPSLRESIGISTTMGMDSFAMLALVGKGGFGKVHQVVYKKTNEIMAMKTLNKKFLITRHAVKDTLSEKNILRKVRHPFVVRLHYAFQTAHNLHLVMDFINGGHLLFHMKKGGLLPEQHARFYLAEIVLALEHLHKMDIIHRDLKPENCLLDSQGHCVLTDFGFARESVSGLDCSSFCGTLEYMAPEVIKKKKYGKAADWWSLGILLYDMLNGQPPFMSSNDHTLQNKILNAPLKYPMFFSANSKTLITGLLQRNIDKRLKVDQIKSHKFFKSINWDMMARKEMNPPFKPNMKQGSYDVSNFDKKLTTTKISESPARSPLSHSQQMIFQGFSYAESPAGATPQYLL